MTDDKDANFPGWFPKINEHRTLGPLEPDDAAASV